MPRGLLIVFLAAAFALIIGPMLLVLSYAVPMQLWAGLLGFAVVVLLLREIIGIRHDPQDRRRLAFLGVTLLGCMAFVVYEFSTMPMQ